MKNVRVWLGLGIWILIAAAVFAGHRSWQSSAGRTVVADITSYLTNQKELVQLEFDSAQTVRYGDPIFSEDKEGNFTRIGEIIRVGSLDSDEMEAVDVDTAYAFFYGGGPEIDANDWLEYHTTPTELAWVVQTMLPPEKRRIIGKLITDAYVENQKEIVGQLRPVVERAMREAGPVIEEDLRAAFQRHQPQLKSIGNRYRKEIVEKDLVPLIENEVWPIVRAKAAPLVDEIGQNIWEKASLFRFGWRVMYDASPLPKRDLTKKEFDRFVKTDAMPIIEDNIDEFIDLQQEILTEVAENPKVREVVGRSIIKIADDPEFQNVVAMILEEVFVDNPRLIAIFERHWKSEQARNAFQLANDRLEPTITGIGEELFGDPHQEITPGFNRVLRNRVLKKDARWFVLHESPVKSGNQTPPSSLKVEVGQTTIQDPFHIPRDRREKEKTPDSGSED